MYKKLCVALCLPALLGAMVHDPAHAQQSAINDAAVRDATQRVQGAFSAARRFLPDPAAAARALADQLASVQSTIRQALQGRPDIVMAGLSRTAEMLERLAPWWLRFRS